MRVCVCFQVNDLKYDPRFEVQKAEQTFHHTATLNVFNLKRLEVEVDPHGRQEGPQKFRLLIKKMYKFAYRL